MKFLANRSGLLAPLTPLRITIVAICLVLTGCGGDSGEREAATGDPGNSADSGNANSSDNNEASTEANQNSAAPSNKAQASRFLGQSTFGPTMTQIDALMQTTYRDWIDAQMALPVSSMREAFDAEQLLNPAQAPNRDWLYEAFWRQSVTGADQLRQRVAFALSQIFVISLREGGVANAPRGAGDFYAMLQGNAFGNFRSLLEDVTLHPMMGVYLSHLGNEKGDELTGRVPDENFAREVMQLFSIGLQELNLDGSVRTSNGQPIDTYETSDVQGLARVFTGFSWNGPDTSTGRFQGWIAESNRAVMPMQAYPLFHSTREKRFLGTVIPAQATPDPLADLTIALDTLFNHANVGPFIGKQLIQRLVTSNPSPAYVARVATVFNNNGLGERGDMTAVIRAVLLDSEARDMTIAARNDAGRIREPVLRFTHWLRSFNGTSVSGKFRILGTDDPATSLGMTVLRSPSVFNFYRPGYVPPKTPIADAGLVSPEMQISHETSTAGYLNTMLNAVYLGGGFNFDVSSAYADSKALADDSGALIDHVDLLLLHGSMDDTLRGQIESAVNRIDLPVEPPAARQDALLARTRLAIYLSLASPQFIVLK